MLQERYILLQPLEHMPHSILEALSLVNGAINRKLNDMSTTYHRRYVGGKRASRFCRRRSLLRLPSPFNKTPSSSPYPRRPVTFASPSYEELLAQLSTLVERQAASREASRRQLQSAPAPLPDQKNQSQTRAAADRTAAAAHTVRRSSSFGSHMPPQITFEEERSRPVTAPDAGWAGDAGHLDVALLQLERASSRLTSLMSQREPAALGAVQQRPATVCGAALRLPSAANDARTPGEDAAKEGLGATSLSSQGSARRIQPLGGLPSTSTSRSSLGAAMDADAITHFWNDDELTELTIRRNSSRLSKRGSSSLGGSSAKLFPSVRALMEGDAKAARSGSPSAAMLASAAPLPVCVEV